MQQEREFGASGKELTAAVNEDDFHVLSSLPSL